MHACRSTLEDPTAGSTPIRAQTPAQGAVAAGAVAGRVRDAQGVPVPFATLVARGTTTGASADADGRYRLALAPGRYVIVASAVGYRAAERAVTLAAGEALALDFALGEATVEGSEVVVTGTMMETFVRDSPVRVEVISPRYLDKVPTVNVMEVISNVNGLYQQIDCGVCGTNNVRINGIDGPYTAVLIDGTPIMSSLGTVYGLNGISPSLIQQIEVIKGPMSTLYGSEALGGVINIITKNPRTAPRLSAHTFGNSEGEAALDVGIVPTRGQLATLLSGTLFYNDRFVDENGDSFADLTLNRRVSLFGKAMLADRSGNERIGLTGRVYAEDRLGGTREFIAAFDDSLRGSGRLYGETIRTRRAELLGAARPFAGQPLRVEFAANTHDQDSYYGDASYQARQQTYFGQLVWPQRFGAASTLLLGSALRYQRYDDNTGSTGVYDEAGELTENRPDNRLIPGVFGQYETVVSSAVRLLGGLRVDYQPDYGPIVSPRLSVQVRPGPATTFRLNGGTGFRIVNLFTEDHAAYSGARATLLLEDLRPERSVSGTASMQHIVPFGANPLTIDLDGFYTYFTNKIEPDYETPGQIRYANLAGSATTRGISLTLGQSLTAIPLSYTLGGTVMDVFTDERGVRAPLEFAPGFQGVANATLQLPGALSLDYTANLTGPMKLPEYEAPFERPGTSPTYSVHNLRLTRDFHVHPGAAHFVVQAYLALENVFDYTQPTPLVDAANPFGPNFDTAYVYGPIHGREVGLGLRVMLAR